MKVGDYLERIGVSRPTAADVETLTTLHEVHMATVPFENLDIPLGHEIVMDENRFLEKIVRQRRGGFCYELNGAFAWLLREIGFDVTLLSARVVGADGAPGPDFDHMALLVRIDDEEWIADVGFGDSFQSPLRLVADAIQPDTDPRDIEYRFTGDNGVWSMWKQEEEALGPRQNEPAAGDGDWSRQYMFTLEARSLDQYAAMCRHQQVSPESSFTKKVVCSRTTKEGRITLTADRLIESSASGRVETLVSREDWYEVLRERFGVVLPGKITRWP